MFSIASHWKDKRLLNVFLHEKHFMINYYDQLFLLLLKVCVLSRFSWPACFRDFLVTLQRGRRWKASREGLSSSTNLSQCFQLQDLGSGAGWEEPRVWQKPFCVHTRGPFVFPSQPGELLGVTVWGGISRAQCEEPCFWTWANVAAAPSLSDFRKVQLLRAWYSS